MANVFERFFGAASQRFAEPTSFPDLPIPVDYPRDGEEESPVWIPTEVDDFFPVEDRLAAGDVMRRLGGISGPRANLVPLSDEDRGLLDGAIRRGGFEVFAYYKSRRYITQLPYAGKWGIFYLEHGIARVTELLELHYPGRGNAMLRAYQFLREHERFHLKFDLFTLAAEAATGRPLYGPLKHALRKHRTSQVEEALANRDAWDWAKQSRIGLGDFAFDFMKLQPGAYARFDEHRMALGGELAANLFDRQFYRGANREDQAHWVGNVPDDLLRDSLCPEYIIRPVALGQLFSPVLRLPPVRNVIEAKSVADELAGKYSSIKPRWEATKRKLLESPGLMGLNFKPWRELPGQWSVRVNDNFRAHLRPLPGSPDTWEVTEIGPHNALGHG